MKRIVLTGGGTAGHVTPNIALLPALRSAGYEISYIGSMEGIGRVKVMVTLEAGSESVLQTDSSVEERQVQETDSSGGTGLTKEKNQSVQTVLTGSGDLPYVVKELTPKVSGIVIMAQGGESPQKASEITAAMEALFGVPAHKIKVLEGVHE